MNFLSETTFFGQMGGISFLDQPLTDSQVQVKEFSVVQEFDVFVDKKEFVFTWTKLFGHS